MLTIAYITNRRDCRIEWFFDSLKNEVAGDWSDIRVVIIDFFALEKGRRVRIAKAARIPITHSTPKPSVWQGPHRLTTQDYFAASNARNTALCYAQDGYICYIDDISVIVPGWLSQLREIMDKGQIALGAYIKVMDLKVTNGQIISFKGMEAQPLDDHELQEQYLRAAGSSYPQGIDSRLAKTLDFGPITAGGSWMFGCSCAMPVEALLDINGWDEDNDSMGSEDYCAGIMMEFAGYSFRYLPRMMTLESEELHHVEKPFLRIIKDDLTEIDASHKMLKMVKDGGRRRAPGYLGDGGITKLRQNILNGAEFPVIKIPDCDWRDGQPLSEM